MTPEQKAVKKSRQRVVERKLNMRRGKRGFEANVREAEAEIEVIKTELGE